MHPSFQLFDEHPSDNNPNKPTSPVLNSETWIQDFSFSKDLAELEKNQPMREKDIQRELKQPIKQPALKPVPKKVAAVTMEKSPPPSLRAVQPASTKTHSTALSSDLSIMQASRILELERQNEELRRDNEILARQIQAFLDEKQALETIVDCKDIELSRYKKIWGNLHLHC